MDALCEELYDRREYVYEMLERMDTNGSGFLGRAEMRSGLSKLGLRLSPSELDAVMRGFDKNGDGRVSYREFYKVLSQEAGGKRRRSSSQSLGSPLGTSRWAIDEPLQALVDDLYRRRDTVYEMLQHYDRVRTRHSVCKPLVFVFVFAGAVTGLIWRFVTSLGAR